MEKGRISEAELAQRLVASRKVMKKVDNGDFEKGAISENMLKSTEELMGENAPTYKPINRTLPQADPTRINQSKLPENIKRAMIENHIPQIGLDSTLDMSFVEHTRKLMEEDGSSVPRHQTSKSEPTRSSNTTTVSSSELERRLTPIIENVIRKTLDEIVDRKLTQILSAQSGQSINENLAIKVGDTIFTGKITKAKSTK